jgi:hypothetical protein
MVEVPGPTVPCPGCGGSVSAGRHAGTSAKTAAPPTATAAAAAPAPAAAPARKQVSLKKTCPACGTQYPGEENKCPQCGASYKAAKIERENTEGDAFTYEKKGIQAGVIGGIIMIAIAAAWFFIGLSAGYIYFYPPVLAAIGAYAIIKGLMTGNVAGGGARRDRR